MKKLDYIVYYLTKKYKNQLLTEELKETIRQECLVLYDFCNLKDKLGKITDIILEHNNGELRIELMISI